MRLQLTADELSRLSPVEPGLHAHCVRVCALASEIASAAAIPVRSALVLQQAALLHHASEVLSPDQGLARLIYDVLGQVYDIRKAVEMPQALAAVLRAYRSFPKRAGDAMAGQLAEILALSNLIDEQIEGREMDEAAAGSLWKALEPLQGMFSERIWDLARRRFPASLTHSARNWEIPVQPDVAKHLVNLLGQTGPYSLSRMAEIVNRDPSIAGRLIEAANSPLFCSRMQITSVRHALAYLGENASRRIVTGLIARSMFGSSGSLRSLWEHSLKTAQFLVNVASAKGFMDPDEALLTGLVHDVGRIALVRQNEAIRYRRLTEASGTATWAEALLYGVDHAELGARILESWRFPEGIVEAVRFHHHPAECDSAGAAALYAAEFWLESDEDLPSGRQLHRSFSRIAMQMDELSQFEAVDPAVGALLKIA